MGGWAPRSCAAMAHQASLLSIYPAAKALRLDRSVLPVPSRAKPFTSEHHHDHHDEVGGRGVWCKAQAMRGGGQEDMLPSSFLHHPAAAAPPPGRSPRRGRPLPGPLVLAPVLPPPHLSRSADTIQQSTAHSSFRLLVYKICTVPIQLAATRRRGPHSHERVDIHVSREQHPQAAVPAPGATGRSSGFGWDWQQREPTAPLSLGLLTELATPKHCTHQTIWLPCASSARHALQGRKQHR